MMLESNRRQRLTCYTVDSFSYHDVASLVVNAEKLLRKDDTFEHSDSGSNFVNAKLRKSIALASSIQQTLSLGRQRLRLRCE